jgi:hypothetical protein
VLPAISMAAVLGPLLLLLSSGKLIAWKIYTPVDNEGRTQGSYFQDQSIRSSNSPDVGRLRWGLPTQVPFFHPDHCITVSLAMEAIGDITASAEVSRLPVQGEEFDTRIQGGILVRTLIPTR